MKITIDTNFLISATQWDYSEAHKLLVKFLEKDIQIFSSREILREFSVVLERDFLYSKEEIVKIIEKVIVFLNLIELTSVIEIIKEDIEDNKILACAVDSDSEYIITYDKHLLKLKEFQGIKILKPEDIREIINQL